VIFVMLEAVSIPLYCSFAVLLIGVVVAWLGLGLKQRTREVVTSVCAVLGLGGALLFGALSLQGFLCLLAMLAASLVAFRPGKLRGLALPVFVVFGGMAMVHQVPGVANPVLMKGVVFSEDAVAYSLYLNFDKALLGLAILLGMRVMPFTLSQWKQGWRELWLVFPVTWISLLALAWHLDFMQWEPKAGMYLLVWIPINLLVTCVAEEGVFRQMMLAWAPSGRRGWLALGLSSICFGLVHYQGGWSYVFLASIAGVFYGLAYRKGGHVGFPILLHFSVNLLHLLLFTYPALAE